MRRNFGASKNSSSYTKLKDALMRSPAHSSRDLSHISETCPLISDSRSSYILNMPLIWHKFGINLEHAPSFAASGSSHHISEARPLIWQFRVIRHVEHDLLLACRWLLPLRERGSTGRFGVKLKRHHWDHEYLSGRKPRVLKKGATSLHKA